jgi:hypothetical protein
MDIYHWSAGLVAVTGRIRDIGQNILGSSSQKGSSSKLQLLPNFVPYRIPRGGFYW